MSRRDTRNKTKHSAIPPTMVHIVGGIFCALREIGGEKREGGDTVRLMRCGLQSKRSMRLSKPSNHPCTKAPTR